MPEGSGLRRRTPRKQLGEKGVPRKQLGERRIKMKYPEIRPENFGFCDVCMNTMKKGKFRFLINYEEGVDRKICNQALKKFEMVAAQMAGRRVKLIKSNLSIQKQFFDKIYKPVYEKWLHEKISPDPSQARGLQPSRIKFKPREKLREGRTSEDNTNFKKQGYSSITFNQKEPPSGEIWGHTTGIFGNIFIRTTRDRNGDFVNHADEEILAAAVVHEFGHFLGVEKRDAFFTKAGGGHCTVPGCTMRHAVPGVMPEAIKNIYLR
jgi:hypothetical protein